MRSDGERDDEDSWNTHGHRESGICPPHSPVQERQGDLLPVRAQRARSGEDHPVMILTSTDAPYKRVCLRTS